MEYITTKINDYILQFDQYGLGAEVLGNSIAEYLAALLLFIVLGVVFKAIQWLVLRKLASLAKKTETDIDDTFIKIVKSLRPGFYLFLAFFFAVQTLDFSDLGGTVLNIILVVWVAYQIVIALQILIDHIIVKRFADEDGDGEADDGIVLFMSRLVKGVLWIVAGLMVLSNFGINVTGLMAGLGIGGLAIAFALQNVFSDLFAAFSIYIDKPFRVGDYILSGNHDGVVEKIGIKSTRLRALHGEEIVISNQELTSARIHNYKKLQERRISSTFGVEYDTPTKKLKKINEIVKKIVDDVSGARFDRIFFTTFGDSALQFGLVYYVESPEYADYLAIQQDINFRIKDEFEKLGVAMAFPTQTIHLSKD